MTHINQWARRLRLGRGPTTLFHLVESEIADRLVFRCGRQMAYRVDRPWEFLNAPADVVACYHCRRKVTP